MRRLGVASLVAVGIMVGGCASPVKQAPSSDYSDTLPDGAGYEMRLSWQGEPRWIVYAALNERDLRKCRASFPMIRDDEIVEFSGKHGFLRLFIASPTKKRDIEARAKHVRMWNCSGGQRLTTRKVVEQRADEHRHMIY